MISDFDTSAAGSTALKAQLQLCQNRYKKALYQWIDQRNAFERGIIDLHRSFRISIAAYHESLVKQSQQILELQSRLASMHALVTRYETTAHSTNHINQPVFMINKQSLSPAAREWHLKYHSEAITGKKIPLPVWATTSTVPERPTHFGRGTPYLKYFGLTDK